MSSKVKKKILKLKESSTLVINEKSKELISEGKKVYQFGFGQSPFPVPALGSTAQSGIREEKADQRVEMSLPSHPQQQPSPFSPC